MAGETTARWGTLGGPWGWGCPGKGGKRGLASPGVGKGGDCPGGVSGGSRRNWGLGEKGFRVQERRNRAGDEQCWGGGGVFQDRGTVLGSCRGTAKGPPRDGR